MPTNPYTNLRNQFVEYANKVASPKQKTYLIYSSLTNTQYYLWDLREAIAAADCLGYETLLQARDGKLDVIFREKRPPRPWNL